ncbi:MAG: ATP-grasp domain-containing protein [Gemmatimonadota bacterium]|nr:MAG: ATP-grasp domain-containing protein [Gemmatimonadota bacterium]
MKSLTSVVRERGLEGWLRRTRGRRPPAIVLGGSVNGLSFARSLSRRGVPTLMLDSEPLIGTYTQHAETVLLPAADEQPEVWVETLERVGSRLDCSAAVFATSDVHGVLLAENEDALRSYYRFLIPGSLAMERIVNKRAQYGVAESVGIPIPRSEFPESVEEAARISKRFPYPCILKPYKAHVARKKVPKKVAVVDSPGQLVAEFGRLASPDVPYMVQEIIPGADSALFGYLAFWDAEGCERAWLTKRKLRQNPPHYGDGSLQVSAEAPEVAELSRRLLEAFDYRGFVGVEFKYDARDGSYKLMEINPRTVSGNQLAISSGVDFPWLGYLYLTGGAAEMPAVSFQPGVKYVNEEWDLKAFLALHKTGDLTLRDWVRSLAGARARAIWALDDPLPLLVVGWRMLKAAARARR